MTARRVAVVTGAARGIGAAMANGLLRAGYDVVAVDVHASGADRVADAGASIVDVVADITDVAACERVVGTTLTRFGAIHVLVNNAALGMGVIAPRFLEFKNRFHDADPDSWRRIVDVNLNGTFLMSRAVVPHLIAQRWGRVINVTTSKTTMLMKGMTPYGSSKAAVEAMSVAWSDELAGSGVTVNVLIPGGGVDTAINPPADVPDRSKLMPPDVMVPPLLWLAGDGSSGTTGRRFLAKLWDRSVPEEDAAAASGFPAGWPLDSHDYFDKVV